MQLSSDQIAFISVASPAVQLSCLRAMLWLMHQAVSWFAIASLSDCSLLKACMYLRRLCRPLVHQYCQDCRLFDCFLESSQGQNLLREEALSGSLPMLPSQINHHH